MKHFDYPHHWYIFVITPFTLRVWRFTKFAVSEDGKELFGEHFKKLKIVYLFIRFIYNDGLLNLLFETQKYSFFSVILDYKTLVKHLHSNIIWLFVVCFFFFAMGSTEVLNSNDKVHLFKRDLFFLFCFQSGSLIDEFFFCLSYTLSLWTCTSFFISSRFWAMEVRKKIQHTLQKKSKLVLLIWIENSNRFYHFGKIIMMRKMFTTFPIKFKC